MPDLIERRLRRRELEPEPRILIVSPEISFLPVGMGNLAERMSARDGVNSTITAQLLGSLYERGADIHIAMPNYRQMFRLNERSIFELEYEKVSRSLPEQRIHLAEDRIFYHTTEIYSNEQRVKMALAFQREVINHTIPQVRPDLIHCNNWMTGLIPAVAKRHGIPCVFSISKAESERVPLSLLEDRGIDAADFWRLLHYTEYPHSYEHARSYLACDLTATAVALADFVIASDWGKVALSERWQEPPLLAIRDTISERMKRGSACGITTPPDSSYDPGEDPMIPLAYGTSGPMEGKRGNKRFLQQRLGLTVDASVPLLFIPTRLTARDRQDIGLIEAIPSWLAEQPGIRLQIVFSGAGDLWEYYAQMPQALRVGDRVAFTASGEANRRGGYAAADYVLDTTRDGHLTIPHAIAKRYGGIPVIYDPESRALPEGSPDPVGGLLTHHRLAACSLDGIWARIRGAEEHFASPSSPRDAFIGTLMKAAWEETSEAMASKYIAIYESLLQRQVAPPIPS